MTGWAADYLALLRGNPALTREEAAEQMGVKLTTLRTRLLARQDVREAEAAIRDLARAQSKYGTLPEGEAAKPKLEDDLPLHFERFLEIYQETDDRIETVRRMQSEGFDITWRDVVQGARIYPNFGAAMADLWDAGVIEAEDAYRRAAKTDAKAAKGFLAANMPEKYGPRLKVDVSVRPQLGPEHRQLITGIRQQYISAPKAQPSALPSSADDIVEGEVLE